MWVFSEVNGVPTFIGKSQQSSEWEWESHKHMQTELQTGMPRALEHLLESRQEASMQGNSPCGTTQRKSNGIMEEAWWKPIKQQKLVSPLCLYWISIFKLFNPYDRGMNHLSRRLISCRWPLPLISYWKLLCNHCTLSSSLFCRMKWEAAVFCQMEKKKLKTKLCCWQKGAESRERWRVWALHDINITFYLFFQM